MLLLLSLGRYICWWTITSRVYHPLSNQCFVLTCFFFKYLRFHYYHWVDTSNGGILVTECTILSGISVSVLTWFIRYLRFHYYHWVDTSNGGLLVSDSIILPVVSVSTLPWFASKFTVPKSCKWNIVESTS
jgi:hypothetical protein